jgi:tetratricopeptide (TPR) repeat protein
VRAGVFVGRSAEVDALCGLGLTALDGRTAAAVLVAEPGLGKTRLLAEVVPRLGVPLLQVQGYETAREIGLGAATGLLRELARAPVAGAQLGSLLVGEVGPAIALETVRLFETSFRCLGELAPLAIVADDLQWADSETLALLHYLVAATAASDEIGLFVLCAARPAPEVAQFAASLGRALAVERFSKLELAPLAREEGADLAVQFAPELGRERAEMLWQRAQGSPFWLVALASENGAERSPARLMRSRYATLDADAAQLFALLLVAAQPLGVLDTAELLGWEEERARRAALALVNRALAVEEGEVVRSVRIAHDLIREVAARDLPDAERRRFHRRLAEWFEGTAGDDVRQLSRALEHRQASGLATAELALRIARSPQRRLLGREGLATLAGIAEGTDDGDGLVLRREVAALAAELGEWTAALEHWAALADRLPDRRGRVGAALAAAMAAFRLGRADEVHAFVARARQSVDGDPVAEIEADFREAQTLLWLENRVSEAQLVVDRSVAAAERLVEQCGGIDGLGDAECGAYVRAQRAKLDAAIRGADAETVACCAELIAAAARDPAEVLTAKSDGIFSMLQFEGLPKPAEPLAGRALEEARRLALPSLEVEAAHWVGWIAHHRGRLDEAVELMQQAVALATRVGPPRRFTVAILRAVAHSIEASRSDWRRSVAAIEEAIAAEPEPHFRLVVRMIHVWLVGRFASPDTAQLEALLAPMAADAAVAGCGRCLWESVLHGAEAQARIGDVAGAVTSLRRWDAAHPRPRPGPGARRAYTLALIEAHRDAAASLPLFKTAAMLAEEAGHDLMRLWIDLETAPKRSRRYGVSRRTPTRRAP